MKKTGTSKFGTPWFAAPSEAGGTINLETMNALQRLWPMHLTPDQTREMAAALSELADHVDGIEHVTREQLQQQLEEQEQQIDQLANDNFEAMTPEQRDAFADDAIRKAAG